MDLVELAKELELLKLALLGVAIVGSRQAAFGGASIATTAIAVADGGGDRAVTVVRASDTNRSQAPQVDRTSKGQGAPSNLRVVGNAGIEHNKLSGLGWYFGGAMDEHGIGIVIQHDESDLAVDGLARVVVAIDVHIGGAGHFGDGDGTAVLALLLGGHRRAGHMMEANGDGRAEGGSVTAFVRCVPDSPLVHVDGSELLNFVCGQEARIRFDGRGERGWREDGRSAEQKEENGGRSRTEHLDEEHLDGAGWLVGLPYIRRRASERVNQIMSCLR